MTKKPNEVDIQEEDYSVHPWKRFLSYLKWYGIILLTITLALAAFAYIKGGVPAMLNALNWALLLAVLSLPMLALLISANTWSGYANRWGQEKYKEMLEGKPEERKFDD